MLLVYWEVIPAFGSIHVHIYMSHLYKGNCTFRIICMPIGSVPPAWFKLILLIKGKNSPFSHKNFVRNFFHALLLVEVQFLLCYSSIRPPSPLFWIANLNGVFFLQVSVQKLEVFITLYQNIGYKEIFSIKNLSMSKFHVFCFLKSV